MRRNVVGASLFVAVSAAVALFACDLFHSTQFSTLCDVEPGVAACNDAGIGDAPPPPTEFCSWQSATANSHALRACAYLSACETPLGDNAFGQCMVDALLAFDCALNPGHQVQGALHAFWDTVQQAKTCADVDRAVFPGKVQTCPPSASFPFAGCGSAFDGGDNSAVRVECDEAGAPARGTNCIMRGQTCQNAACVGTRGASCSSSGCEGALLHDCEGADAGAASDRGTDCSQNGAGMCLNTPGVGPACVPNGDVLCDAGAGAVCGMNGVVSGCLAGKQESVDCNLLTGPGSCDPGAAQAVVWDISTACQVDSGGCGPDQCPDNDTLTSCARGQTFQTSCSSWGLGPCTMVQTVEGPRAACGRPKP